MSFLKSQRLGRRIGFRYLRAKKSSSFLSLITGISIGGVAVGVMTLVVTLSVMSGFENQLKTSLFNAESHVLIQKSEANLFEKDPALLSRISSAYPKIKEVYPVLQTEVIVRSGRKITGALFKGIEGDYLQWVKSKTTEVAESELDRENISKVWIGAEMALDLGVAVGEVITIVSPVETQGPMGVVPRVKKVFVEGIFRTGVPEQELHTIFTPIETVESFLRAPGLYSQIEVKVVDLDDAPKAAEVIDIDFKQMGFLVRPWQELNSHLFESLRLERAAMFFILAIIVVVATFNIVSTLTMMVIEKKKSLSILRAMGATQKQIGSVFLWEGFAIGFIGVGVGCGFGFLICLFLKKFPIIELPEYYYDRTLPVIINGSSFAIVAVTALGIVLLGAFIPAKKAAELPLMEGIRNS